MTEGVPLDAVNDLEERLRGSEALTFATRLRSAESLAAELEGSVELRSTGDVLIDLRGDLGAVETRLTSSPDGSRFVVQAEGRDIVLPAPTDFRDILAAGFVRLGLLDVVLRLLGRRLPRSADEFRRNYALEAFAEVEAESSRPDLSDCRGYALSVRGHLFEVATATLWIERIGGDPRERSQSVRAPVNLSSTEIYWDFRAS